MTNLLLLLATLFNPVQADDPVFSGPQPGEQLASFTILGAIGKEADQKIDAFAKTGEKPNVIVFVHERTRPAFGLANAVMRMVSDRGPEKVNGVMVYLADDPTEAANWMNQVRRHFPDGIKKGISPDGQEGPGAYGLNRNVAVTLLVAKGKIVTANFALVQPSLEVDAPKIFKAIADVLGEKEPVDIAKYVPGYGQKMEQDPQLRPLLRPLIQKNATDEQVDAAAKKIEDYVAKNATAKRQVGDIARRIIAAKKLDNYGTKKCQQYLKKWAQEFKAEKARSKPARPQPETRDQAP